MDGVLCCIDEKSGSMEFAASNNPLWLGRDGAMIEFKADKMPVGKFPGVTRKFTKQEIQLQQGDIIYLFSDGYADQFGGPKGKKFKYRPFQEILLKNSSVTFEKQKESLSIIHEQWKAGFEQVDDILVVGFRF